MDKLTDGAEIVAGCFRIRPEQRGQMRARAGIASAQHQMQRSRNLVVYSQESWANAASARMARFLSLLTRTRTALSSKPSCPCSCSRPAHALMQVCLGCDGVAAQCLAATQHPGPAHWLHDAGVSCVPLQTYAHLSVMLCRPPSRQGDVWTASSLSLATSTAAPAASTFSLLQICGTKLKAATEVAGASA